MKEPADKIIELIQEHSVHVFAEIGVGKFKTGKAVLTHPVTSKLIKEYWAIDPYQTMPQYAKKTYDPYMVKMSLMSQFEWNALYCRVCKHLRWFPQLKLLRLSSETAASVFKPNHAYFDMVFIDSEHTYFALQKDIAVWTPLIKPYGILSGHDYGGIYWEVTQAVDHLIKDPVIYPDDHIWMTYI